MNLLLAFKIIKPPGELAINKLMMLLNFQFVKQFVIIMIMAGKYCQ